MQVQPNTVRLDVTAHAVRGPTAARVRWQDTEPPHDVREQWFDSLVDAEEFIAGMVEVQTDPADEIRHPVGPSVSKHSEV